MVSGIREIGREPWNAVAGTANPFTRYEFLEALEATGCVGPAKGWTPCHLALYQGTGRRRSLRAAMPLYLKDNSWGEYVFDWSWAEAWHSNGLSYYPKFVSSVPYTPSVGRRLLVTEGAGEQEAKAIAEAFRDRVMGRAEEEGASSWHVLFPTPEESLLLQLTDLPRRKACQFHWFNECYGGFDDFLADLSSRKRKNIRKERQTVAAAGVDFQWLNGDEIDKRQWAEFYRFYQNTYLVRGRQGYLSLEFFLRLGETMPENLKLLVACYEGQSIAAALFFTGADTLYGRYWGSREDYQFLHFETCYYQGIDYCIRQGLKRFDSGAQGEHKIQRGFRPVATWSNHWIARPDFAGAIDGFLQRETLYIDRYMEEAAKLLPFRNSEVKK